MLEVGQHIGNYVVRSQLGEGGMGVVYLAEHPLIGRRVAIKVLHSQMARSPDLVSRFVTEAQAVTRIGHPNIVDITDFGQTPTGESYFVMEYLAGESLGGRLKRAGPMGIGDALVITQQVADALAASHAAGILHRDLKPDNIHLIHRGPDSQFVKVLDFGLAKLTAASDQVSHKTRTGSVMGTPYYMAPEQCAGKSDIDARADVYGLGVILFEMLSGTVPFTGEGYGEVIVKHMTEPPRRVRELRPECPAWLDELCARMLRKERKERVQTMEELRQTIDSCLAGEPLPQARKPVSSPSLIESTRARSRPRRPARRRGALVAAVAGIILAGGAAGAYILLRQEPRPAPAPLPAPATAPVAVVAPPDAAPPPPAIKEPEPPARITIHFESDPAGAAVALADGKELGRTPFDWVVDPSDDAAEITFKKDGYEPKTRQVSLKQPNSVDVALSRTRRPPRPPPAAKPAEPAAPEPPKPAEDDLMPPPGN